MSLKKSLRNIFLGEMSREKGQSSFEYTILLSIMVALTIITGSTFLSRVKFVGRMMLMNAQQMTIALP